MLSKLNVGNESESGKLEIVLMHRPGQEFRRLTKDNLEVLLFDALPNINQTHKSHDVLTKYLRDNDVQVLYVQSLLLETLIFSEEACHKLIQGILDHNLFYIDHQQEEILMALHEWLINRTAEQLTNDVITGVACTRNELGSSSAAETLFELCHSNIEFIIPPLPNLLFTRDAFSIIEKNVFIWQMAKLARQNEPLIFRIIFQYHPQLSNSGLKIIEWQTINNYDEHPTVEGGDIAYVGDDILLIGCGERTNHAGIEALAHTNLFHQIIVVVIPPQRDYMHLDTILSSVGKNAFTLHSVLADRLEVFTVEIHDHNNQFVKPTWISHGYDIRDALRELLNDSEIIFYDAEDKKTSIIEQQECRHNVLVIDDCHVVTYAGGDSQKGVVAQMTCNKACRVGLIPIEGLLEGGGGVHCMTNAIRRRYSYY